MRIVAKTALAGGVTGAQVVPIRQEVVPSVDVAGLKAQVAELKDTLGKLVTAHNATVTELNKVKASHATLARGASSLAKHFQGFVAASQIQYTPAIIQRAQAQALQQPRPQAQPVPRPQAQQTPAPRASAPSQQTVDAEPAATMGDPWTQRDAAFYEGGEGDEG